jgi:hypothetical protein
VLLSSNTERAPQWLWALGIGAGLFLLGWGVGTWQSTPDFSQWGDSFAPWAAALNFLALMAAIWALNLQRVELQESREDRRAQTEAQTAQATAQREQVDALLEQARAMQEQTQAQLGQARVLQAQVDTQRELVAIQQEYARVLGEQVQAQREQVVAQQQYAIAFHEQVQTQREQAAVQQRAADIAYLQLQADLGKLELQHGETTAGLLKWQADANGSRNGTVRTEDKNALLLGQASALAACRRVEAEIRRISRRLETLEPPASEPE